MKVTVPKLLASIILIGLFLVPLFVHAQKTYARLYDDYYDPFSQVGNEVQEFGGYYGGAELITVATTSEAPDVKSRLIETMKLRFPEFAYTMPTVRFEKVKYSFNELRNYYRNYFNRIYVLSKGIVSSSIDLQHNRINIGIVSKYSVNRLHWLGEMIHIPNDVIKIEVTGPIIDI